MSHFTVLTAIEIPQDLTTDFKEKIPDSYVEQFLARRQFTERFSTNAADNKSKQQIQKITDQVYIELLAESLAVDRLEPYCENTEDPAYLSFIDMTEEGRTVYDNQCVDCVRMPGGRIISCYYPEFSDLYELYDNKVYKRRYGPLHHRKRTAKAKKILPLPDYPLKKLYTSFDDFMENYYGCARDEETGRYGFYRNPNATWDWCEIGGRWPLRFLVKADCSLVVYGEPSYLFKEPPKRDAPDGYHWVTGARKCDIAWDMMRKLAQEHYTKWFYEYEAWFQKGEIPREAQSLLLKEDGIMSWTDYVYRKDETLDAYLDRMGVSDQYRYPLSTFACVDGDGWSSQGDMGYFGFSTDNKDEEVWNKLVDDFIVRQTDDTVLVSVDCHI